MRIPTRDTHGSMNLGQAVAVCLYELMRDPTALAQPGNGNPASSADIERITDTLLLALRASEYPKLNTSKSFHAAVRRVIRRLHLRQGDAEFLLGMLRQMIWKIKKNDEDAQG